MKFLGIEFAPLRVPLRRRLQIMAVAYYTIIVIFGFPLSWLLTLYILLFCNLWLKMFMIAYLVHIFYYPEARFKGIWSKKIFNWTINWIGWRYMCEYYPITVIKTTDLDPSRNYLFCSLPHGVLGSGLSAGLASTGAGADKIFPGLDFHIMTLELSFKTPFFREFLLTQGIRSCDAESINYHLSTKSEDNRGQVAMVVIGGAAEAFYSKPGTYHLLLKKRKGFVKLALKNGAPLVPVFSFGETDLYDQMDIPEGSILKKFVDFIKKHLGFALIIPVGRGFFQYSFGLLPRRKPIFVVVGAPINLPKIEEPTMEVVDKYHAMFTESVIDLFETHKSKYIENHENTSLVFIDK